MAALHAGRHTLRNPKSKHLRERERLLRERLSGERLREPLRPRRCRGEPDLERLLDAGLPERLQRRRSRRMS